MQDRRAALRAEYRFLKITDPLSLDLATCFATVVLGCRDKAALRGYSSDDERAELMRVLGVQRRKHWRGSEPPASEWRAIRYRALCLRRKYGSADSEGPIRLGVNVLRKGLGISQCDADVLTALLPLCWNSELVAVAERLMQSCSLSVAGLVAKVSGLPKQQIEQAMGSRGRLVMFGLLDDCRHNRRILDEDCISTVREWLLAGDQSPAALLTGRCRPAPPARLGSDAFTLNKDLPRLTQVLSRSLDQRKKGVNVLIYGRPGTGKTELSRYLAQATSAQLHEVSTEDSDGDPLAGYQRLKALCLASTILQRSPRTMLAFDEVEEVLSEPFGFGRFFGRRSQQPHKGWINTLLESNSLPVVWICNQIDEIDPAFLRRFDEVIELRMPPASVRRKIIEQSFVNEPISPDCRDRLTQIEALPPAVITRAAATVALLELPTVEQRDLVASRCVENTLRAMQLIRKLPRPVLPGHYDPDAVMTDRPVATVLEMIRRRSGGRICLFGPPGTGKTALAHYIAQDLDRPLLIKRASDLLGMYVGQSEKAIASAFDQADYEGSVLLIDEADSLLRTREGAHRSWEVTQVNEMLTQMETFDGVFIASTNAVDQLDAASLRRFDFKIGFDYLRPAQRVAMMQRLITDLDAAAPKPEELATLDRLDCLTPGDFAVVRRQFEFSETSPNASELIDSLRAEARAKMPAKAAIGFR